MSIESRSRLPRPDNESRSPGRFVPRRGRHEQTSHPFIIGTRPWGPRQPEHLFEYQDASRIGKRRGPAARVVENRPQIVATRGSSRRWSRSRPPRLPPRQRRGHRRPRRPVGRPRLLQRPLAHRPARPDRRPRRGRSTTAFFARRLERAVALRRDWLEPRRRHRRLSARPFRGRRPERAGRRSLRRHARDGVLRGRHVPLSRRRSRRRCCGTFPDSAVLLVRRGARAEAGVVRLPAAGAAAAGRHHRARRAASASRRAASTRPASSSTSATTASSLAELLRRQARARPVLQHRRLRGLRQGAGRGRGGGRRRSRRAGARRWRRQNANLNQVPHPLRAGRPVPLAARHDRRRASGSTWSCSTRRSRRATARRSITR